MIEIIRLHPADNVAVAVSPLKKGHTVQEAGSSVTIQEDVEGGHKIALRPIRAGESVIKYGYEIGKAQQDIAPGEWVHTHNIKTGLGETLHYEYHPKAVPLTPEEPKMFQGYRRKDGSAGIRNELWILPTVGCVNSVAKRLEQLAGPLAEGRFDGVHAFTHPFGCSQLGEDHHNTQMALAGLCRHPNAGAVLVLGLGCENNNIPQFRQVLGETDPHRVQFLNCQDEEDEIAAAMKLLHKLADYAASFHREPIPASELVVGLKCGGSDGFSGITANPCVGAFSDRLVAMGGTTILTEVPEMFGAETILMDRCQNREVFEKTVRLINDFKAYFTSNHQPIYENPSPGNKKGGISTLEDKSLGCTQKSGDAPVMDVLTYGEKAVQKGLNLLNAPGNDLVASTALAVSGAHLVLFTTGRGTPFGCPAPTVKISSNSPLAGRKQNWIDFDAGRILQGVPIPQAAEELLDYVLQVASGERQTNNEAHNYREISIFKQGVTL